jgi:phospholipase C
MRLRVSVQGPRMTEVSLVNAYGGQYRVRGGRSVDVDTARAAGWYDLTATVAGSSWTRVAAGHLETGRASSSDPALGR